MQLWASACDDWQWMVRHITLSIVIGWWCHLRKRGSGWFFLEAGLSNVQINQGKMFKNIRSIFIWNSWIICDVYLNIFQQKSTLHCSGPLSQILYTNLFPWCFKRNWSNLDSVNLRYSPMMKRCHINLRRLDLRKIYSCRYVKKKNVSKRFPAVNNGNNGMFEDVFWQDQKAMFFS